MRKTQILLQLTTLGGQFRLVCRLSSFFNTLFVTTLHQQPLNRQAGLLDKRLFITNKPVTVTERPLRSQTGKNG